MSHWHNISCAYTGSIWTCICKIWSFYEQCCHSDSGTQMMTPTMMTTPMTDDNDTRQTNHDCIGSLVCMPNEPKIYWKIRKIQQKTIMFLKSVQTYLALFRNPNQGKIICRNFHFIYKLKCCKRIVLQAFEAKKVTEFFDLNF